MGLPWLRTAVQASMKLTLEERQTSTTNSSRWHHIQYQPTRLIVALPSGLVDKHCDCALHGGPVHWGNHSQAGQRPSSLLRRCRLYSNAPTIGQCIVPAGIHMGLLYYTLTKMMMIN